MIWGERVDVPVIKQKMGADPASVAFDTLSSAVANNADVVIIDTCLLYTSKYCRQQFCIKYVNIETKVIIGFNRLFIRLN